MKAFFIHNPEEGTDLFITPESDQLLNADKETMYEFISVQPDFKQWQGKSLGQTPPESLGAVVATRKDDGDVCILHEALWQERMARLLGAP